MKSKIIVFLKGMAMGIADIIPGVSGGTIAFISGIYQTLLESITAFNLQLLREFFNGNFKGVWQKINGGFLVALLSGIFCSLLFFSKIIGYLLQNHKIAVWSFFFGLVSGSVWVLFKTIKKWSFVGFFLWVLAIFTAYYFTVIPPVFSSDEKTSLLFLFFSGALAACALILPGISGAFILVLLGSYATVLNAIEMRDFQIIAVVVLGAVSGLVLFSKILKYLFKHHPNTMTIVLTGFIIGSLNKIWAWKKVISGRENSVLPQNYEGDPQIFLALCLVLLGVLIILGLAYFSKNKNNISIK